jgi:outer membrane protein OmpA-like peptidoglycan-associated protein
VVPPPDRDRDTVRDERDRCPDVPALTPDGCPPDTDGDGIADPDDACPTQPGEAPSGCPELDLDQDGVKLPCDLCPKEPGQAPDGCPVRDSDGDGFLDNQDKCPKEPETKNGHEDDDGCPDEIPAEVRAFTGAIEGIKFERGSATIAQSSFETLAKAAAVLKKFPSIRMEITGHTSSEGGDAINVPLSEDRAQSVKDWLVNAGIEPSRIQARGAASTEPVADNNTEAGRRQNRRIEFKVLQ